MDRLSRPWQRCCMDAECGIVVNFANPEGLMVDSVSCLWATSIAVSAGDYDRDECKNLDSAGCVQAERALTGAAREPVWVPCFRA